jgi:thiol-disulfide isomerase/thioredoxin
MIPLDTQEQFEELWTDPNGKPFVIWFSAKWCGPCQRMDKAVLEEAAREAGMDIYYCDYTVNEYTPGYCNVRAFPTFQIIAPPRKVVSKLTNSNTDSVCTWIKTCCTKKYE